ncbi:MAG: S8 family serine peptidase [Propionibacteriaceae bacterium]
MAVVTSVVGGVMPLSASAAPAVPTDRAATRYLVRLTPDTGAATTSRIQGHRVALRTSATYRQAVDGFAARLTPAEVTRLRADGRVLSVEPDQIVHATSTQTKAPWGLDRIDQRATASDGRYLYGSTGRGVTAYVVDTGIRTTHTQFGGRARSGYDFVDHDATAQDCNGHGTHVAGTLGGKTFGVAKGVSIVALRVLDCDGEGYESDVVAALDWVLVHHGSTSSVVNLSIGGSPSQIIDDAIAALTKAGVTVVVAAGNDDESACRSSPARAPSALTVGATTRTDARADFSNYGSCVDLFAPGEGIRSAWASSDTASVVEDGTSMASPHVAGAVARYLQTHRTASPAQVRTALLKDVTPAVTGSHSSPKSLLFVRSGAPTSPQKSVATTQRSAPHTITLRWQAPAYTFGAKVTGYVVTRSGTDAKGKRYAGKKLSASARSYTWQGLRHRHAYTVTVRAVNSVGAGTVSSKRVTTR